MLKSFKFLLIVVIGLSILSGCSKPKLAHEQILDGNSFNKMNDTYVDFLRQTRTNSFTKKETKKVYNEMDRILKNQGMRSIKAKNRLYLSCKIVKSIKNFSRAKCKLKDLHGNTIYRSFGESTYSNTGYKRDNDAFAIFAAMKNIKKVPEKVYSSSYKFYVKSNKERYLHSNWIMDTNKCKHYNPNSMKNKSITWDGKCLDGYSTGYGIQQWYKSGKKNKKYIGYMKKGKKHGRGTDWYSNGDKYIGDYDNGKKHGKGKYYWINGDEHIGGYNNGRISGNGIKTFANGDKYIGNYAYGKRHGKGKLILANGIIYEGKWSNGKRNKNAKKTVPDSVAYKNMKKRNGYTYVRFLKKYPNSKIVHDILNDETKVEKILTQYAGYDYYNSGQVAEKLDELIKMFPREKYFVKKATDKMIRMKIADARTIPQYEALLAQYSNTKYKGRIKKYIKDIKKRREYANKPSSRKKSTSSGGGLFGMLNSSMGRLAKSTGYDSSSSTVGSIKSDAYKILKRDSKSIKIKCLKSGDKLTLFVKSKYSKAYCKYQTINTCFEHERYSTLDKAAKESCRYR